MSKQPEVMEIVDRRSRTDIDAGTIKTDPDGKIAIHDHPDLVTLAEVDRVYSEPHPIKDYLLVRQNAKETTYHGTRFHIPESAQENPNKGVVVAVGPELASSEEKGQGPVKPGDVVTFGKYNAEPIDIDGENYQLVRFHDVKLVESVTYAIG
jgi:co-chaperonin GroES (HSP10)